MKPIPLSLTWSLVGLLQWVLPILACAWAVRTNKSRVQILFLSVGAAVVAGLFMFVPLVQMATRVGDEFDGVLYQLANLLLSSAILGTLVGVVGIVLQKVGQQRARRA